MNNFLLDENHNTYSYYLLMMLLINQDWTSYIWAYFSKTMISLGPFKLINFIFFFLQWGHTLACINLLFFYLGPIAGLIKRKENSSHLWYNTGTTLLSSKLISFQAYWLRWKCSFSSLVSLLSLSNALSGGKKEVTTTVTVDPSRQNLKPDWLLHVIL